MDFQGPHHFVKSNYDENSINKNNYDECVSESEAWVYC